MADIEKTTLTGDDELREEIIARFKYCQESYADWKVVAEEDYSFSLGEQWTPDEVAELEEEGRPHLVFNRIRPVINIISGYQRANSSRIKITPEGSEDKQFSDVLDRVLMAVDKWSKLEYKLGYQFDDGITCGKGLLEASLDYMKDPIFGELKFSLVHFNAILIDPDSKEYDFNEDAEYAFKVVRMTKKKLIALRPEKKALIEGFVSDNDDPMENGTGVIDELGDSDDYGNNKRAYSQTTKIGDDESEHEGDQKFTYKEYFHKKFVYKYYVVNKDDGSPERFESQEDADAFIVKQGSGKVFKRQIPEMWVSGYVCGHILFDEKSPFEPLYSGFPFFRFIAEWSPSAESEKLRVMGMTRQLKDPQREKNKSKSQYLHILNTQANSGWVGDEDALNEPGWQALEKMGAKPGLTIRKKKGADLHEILPKGPNQGHYQREEMADNEIKQISNVNPDLLGMQESNASGKAISLRIKQAVLALTRIFNNYRYTKEIIGKFILKIIPLLFDVSKMKKVVGEGFMQANQINEGKLSAYLQMISDEKYDVSVIEAGSSETARYETLSTLTELVQAGQQIPMEILIDFMDFPNSEEVKQKIAAYREQMMKQAQAANAQKTGAMPGV